MITSISIENFALIEKLSIQFSNGFSTITGETGAGKSILLGALGLVLGKRAELSSLKNKDEKCVVEATFTIKEYNLSSFFTQNDLDYEDETIIRREILPSGKSRAFINDTPVNLQELAELGAFLVDIHSQNQTQELSENTQQFLIIDAVASNSDLLLHYKSVLKEFKDSNASIHDKKLLLSGVLKEQDFNSFLLEELNQAKLENVDQVELELEYEKLNNVEFIKEQLQKINLISNDEQIGVLQSLKEIKASFHKITVFSKNFESLFERLNSVLIEFDDIDKEIGAEMESLVSDPEQLEIINQKLQLLYSLLKKHQVTSVTELVSIQNELEEKVFSVTHLENEISVLEAKTLELELQLKEIASQLRKKRLETIPLLIQNIENILIQLGMPNARFKIELHPTNSFSSNGSDEIEFLFSANKGSDFGLLKKVASGGELSRIMLAVKSILAQYSKLPTILFDEIDTGVSGEIADKMGEIMKQMSQTMQVISITHLPQIASKGKEHFKVYKTEQKHHTVTQISKLDQTERLTEIAQMLSGSVVTESAFNNAKELLK
jgi:DNA repair protein RecN (Recombination protein N)